jgi:tetratricopeptide (TPR) repeat protein
MNIYYQMAEDIRNDGGDSRKIRDVLYKKVLVDCEQVLKLRGDVPDAYFDRAIANLFLGKPKDKVIRDLQRTLELAPDHQYAIEEMGIVMDEEVPDQPEVAAKWYRKYDQLFPVADPDMLFRRAQIQTRMKQFADAYTTIQRAIALDPANLSYYEARAEAEKGLGYTELQIQRDRIEGDRAAVEFLLRRGNKEDLESARNLDKHRWMILSDLGDKFSNEQTRCDAEVTTCLAFKVTHHHAEKTFLKVVEVHPSEGEFHIVRIDRGASDGIVLGSAGNVYCPPSKENGHERKAARIGTAEVVSVEPDTALLKVKVADPKGDGMVRIGDAIELSVRTPVLAQRSKLWSVLNYSITFVDRNGGKIVDSRTLFSEESPALDGQIYGRLLDEIHETGRLDGDMIDQHDSIGNVTATAQPGSLRQVLEEANEEDLDRFFQHIVKYPANYFGEDWKIGLLYAYWVKAGMPED